MSIYCKFVCANLFQKIKIKKLKIVAFILVISVTYTFVSCTGQSKEKKEHGENHESRERGEHSRDVGGDREGEESGTQFKKTDKYDNTRNGARLVLAYDKTSNSFKGTVENTTTKELERVRVEVHLSNGTELGPTTPKNLAPGEKMEVTLAATEKAFDGWSAHPEVGNEEHGHGSEGEHSHDSESSDEHGSKKEGEGEHK